MTGFIKLPCLDRQRPAVINVSQVKSFWLETSGGLKCVRFKMVGDNILEASFNTKEQAEEFYDKIVNLYITEI